MSAIHVIQDSKLVAVSHLIGLEQLPRLETAVKDYVMERVLCSEILSQLGISTKREWKSNFFERHNILGNNVLEI